MIYQPRPYQLEAEQAVFDYFAKGNVGNPVIAMPGGTGKSLVIAMIIKRIMQTCPNWRGMMLTHVEKLIVQNAEKLQGIWSTAPLGIYSAGLKSRDMILPIVFGGIQSVAKAIKKTIEDNTSLTPLHLQHFGWRDFILVDECHLISPRETAEYQYAIMMLKRINPALVVIGLTATPYRLRQGMITDPYLTFNDDGTTNDHRIFTDICYDITGIEAFNRMVADGYLAPLVAKRTDTHYDISQVRIGADGDYSQKGLAEATSDEKITREAVREMVAMADGRECSLVFTSSVENSEKVCAMLQNCGLNAGVMHSKRDAKQNAETWKAFERGQLQWLVNKDMLTTGIDHPPIDFIGMLRHTMSPGLWVQMLCRGTRPYEGKRNCLVADFAKNCERLGPINDPVKPRPKGQKTGDAPIKICDSCGAYNHASARSCIECGESFSFETKIFKAASVAEPMRIDAPVVETFTVKKVIYAVHEKIGSAPMIKVSYFVDGFKMFNEYIGLEHPGLFGKRARDWWRQRHAIEPPVTVFEAMKYTNELRAPSEIRVHTNLKYPDILQYNF